jgi:hypothetical protein
LFLFNSFDLVGSEAFEVIGFETMVSQHRFSGVEVLCHKVVIISVIKLDLAPHQQVLLFLVVTVTLFLSKL